MARLSLQIKNVASLLLATGASVAWGVASKRFFHTSPRPALAFAAAGTLLLLGQLALLFIKSKEEEELSLVRKQRMAAVQQSIKEDERLSIRIQKEINSGNIDAVRKWTAYRRSRDGK